jgi:hypothetical protein
MTLISKLAISLFISVTSIFVLHKPPAPTPAETQPAPITVWQGLEPASPLPTTTVVTTPITQPDACQTVFDMARHVGWPEHELSMVVSVAYRESRCQPDAFNANDTLNRDSHMALCRSTTERGANRQSIGLTAICRHTA